MMRWSALLPNACLALVIGSCAGPDGLDRLYSVTFGMEDLTTSFTGSPTLTIHELGGSVEDFVARELDSWSYAARVVHWPERSRVAGHWAFDAGDGDHLPMFTFVPDAPLEERWYALQVNFDMLPVRRGTYESAPALDESGRGRHFWDDGWTTSRFHVGSQPLVRVIGGPVPPEDGRAGGGSFGVGFTEPVVSETGFLPEELASVTVGGRPVDCRLSVPAPPVRAGEVLSGWRWVCASPAVAGQLQITLSAEARSFRGASGVAVRYCGTDGGTVWNAERDVVATHCDPAAFTAPREGP